MMGCSRRAVIVTVTVAGFSASSVTLNTNHPLAGNDLTWELKLTAILQGNGIVLQGCEPFNMDCANGEPKMATHKLIGVQNAERNSGDTGKSR